jgi:hypothetical protein
MCSAVSLGEATYRISIRFCFLAAKCSGCMIWHTSALESIPDDAPGYTVPTRYRKHYFVNVSIKLKTGISSWKDEKQIQFNNKKVTCILQSLHLVKLLIRWLCWLNYGVSDTMNKMRVHYTHLYLRVTKSKSLPIN